MVLKKIISKKDFQAEGDGVQWTFVNLYENDKYKKYLLPALKDIVYLLNVTCLCRNFRCNKKLILLHLCVCLFFFKKAFIRCSSAIGRWVVANTSLNVVTPESQSIYCLPTCFCLNRNYSLLLF